MVKGEAGGPRSPPFVNGNFLNIYLKTTYPEEGGGRRSPLAFQITKKMCFNMHENYAHSPGRIFAFVVAVVSCPGGSSLRDVFPSAEKARAEEEGGGGRLKKGREVRKRKVRPGRTHRSRGV